MCITRGIFQEFLESVFPRWQCWHRQCGLSSLLVPHHSIILTQQQHPESFFLVSDIRYHWCTTLTTQALNLKKVFSVFWYNCQDGTHPNNQKSSCQTFGNCDKLPVGLLQLAVLLLLWRTDSNASISEFWLVWDQIAWNWGEKDIWRKCGPVLRPFPDFKTLLNKEVPRGLHFEPKRYFVKGPFSRFVSTGGNLTKCL